MATTIYARKTTTYPRAIPPTAYRDLLLVASSDSAASLSTSSTTPASPEERPFLVSTTPMGFWSERVATEVTIAGSIEFIVRVQTTVGHTGRLRARLFKITAGGSAVETLIVQADASADLVSGATTYTFSATPSASVVVAPGERFIWRLSVVPAAGGFGSGNATMLYGSLSPQLCSATFTETVTFRANGVILYFQPSSSGIGNFFNMTPTLDGGALADGIVNTTAGGTDIQWTRTAGGTVLEWISERMKAPGWTADSIALFGSAAADAPQVGALESNVAANASWRMKLFRRQPSGAEILVATWTFTQIEFTTTLLTYQMTTAKCTSALAQVTNFAEDDRFVMRAYCVPFTGLTMGGGFTCTLRYNRQTVGTGFALFTLLDSPELKTSGDPDKVEGPVPDGLPMSGVGN